MGLTYLDIEWSVSVSAGRCRRHVLVEYQGEGHGETKDRVALRADREGKDLDVVPV